MLWTSRLPHCVADKVTRESIHHGERWRVGRVISSAIQTDQELFHGLVLNVPAAQP
jgi:hypothetical protein